MSKTNGSDPFKRHKTRHRGITYRERADGSRTYAVYDRGAYITVAGGEQDAVAFQADLRANRSRGEQVARPSKLTFAEVAEQWFESKHRLRAWTRISYRASLDRILLPPLRLDEGRGDHGRGRSGADPRTRQAGARHVVHREPPEGQRGPSYKTVRIIADRLNVLPELLETGAQCDRDG
jgi:hypothetical protein